MQQRKIEATSERTETSTTYALPSGELETAVYAGPIRQKSGDTWRAIDTSLSDTGSVLEPDVAAAEIKVSDGADTALVSVAKGDKVFGMDWESKLPTPKVKDDTASYDLGAGQTLTVTALAEGFSQNVVLESVPKGALEYRIPLALKGLKLSLAESGHLRLTDDGGKLVAEAPAPMMWDSSKDAVSGESKHLSEVGTKVETAADGSQTLVLAPDPAFFNKDLTYPVTVDPTSTLAVTTDTWVATNYNDSQVSSAELKSGTYDAGTTVARSYLKFDVAPFKGKHITDTNLALYSYWSSSCSTAGAGTEVRRVTGAWSSSDITWAAQPATTATGAVTSTAAKGFSADCPAGTVNFDIDAIVQAWADGSANQGLRIAGKDEKDSLTWRRYHSANHISGDGSSEPHLTVTYNSYPAAPSSTAIAPSQVNAYNGKRYVTSLTPSLSAKVTDPDGATTKAQFEITADPGYADTTYSYTGTSASVPSGSTATLTITSANAFPSGKHLRYRVRAYDGTDYGAWTGYTTFVLNTGKPNASTISCDTYQENSWMTKADAPVACTIDTDSDDGAGYHWGLDAPSLPNKKLDTTNGTGGDTQTVSINPAEGWHTLYARTVDSGGNLSTATTAYSFGVGADGAAILSPADGADTARRLTLSAKGLSSYTGMTWQYRRGEADQWAAVPASDVTASGPAVSAWPVKVTEGAAPKLVWNTVASLSEDGVIELRAAFTDGKTTGHSQTVEVTLDRDAGTAPTGEAGPGEVNLLTGDFTLSKSDATAFSASVERTFSSRANDSDSEGQAPIFGPGWISSVDAGAASGYTQLRKTSATSVEIVRQDGSTIAFTATSDGKWAPQAEFGTLTLSGSLTGTSFTLKDSLANVTVFAKAAGDAVTWPLASDAAAVDDTKTTIVSEMTTVGTSKLSRPKYVISPSEAVLVATCQADPSAKGCRVLEFVYADATTATDAALGDYKGQVKSLRLWATDAGATKATVETLVSYAYGKTGWLREAWDPRRGTALKASYTYGADGRITTLAEEGELPWTFTYGKAGSALTAGEGMLLRASRPTLAQGSATETSGTATTSIVYDVPLSGTKAPYQMDKGTIAAWAQDEAPTDATAIFDTTTVPTSHSGGDLTSNGYAGAEITYLNADAEETNTAGAGSGITTTEYDTFGNIVSELPAVNRTLALGTADGAADTLAALGLSEISTAERAEQLSTQSVYSADGDRQLHEYGPLRLVTLTTELKGTTAESTLPAGTTVVARAHSAFRYDENRPADAKVSGLLTSATAGGSVEGYLAEADTRTTTTAYDWATGLETSRTSGKDGKAVTYQTYDSKGRVATSRTARSNGSDAGTLVHTYYTSGGEGVCANRPEWAGMLCRTAPAAKVTGGGAQPDELMTTVRTYDRWGQLATTTDTANGSTRKTTVTTDSSGRTLKTESTGGVGEAVPASTITYNKDNGQVETQSSGGQTIKFLHDALGRLISYEDGAGNTTTTAYDALDRPVKVTDSVPSTTTYAYNTDGRLKSVADSVAGTFTVTYDKEGRLTGQTLPGGYRLTVSTDTAGNVTGRTYTDAGGVTVLSDTADIAVSGLRIGHTQTDGATTESHYSYDEDGRLTKASDATAAGCTGRSYAFDASSNRTSLTTASDDCDSATDDTATSSKSYTYDTADRLIADGHSYDAFGRTTKRGDTTLDYFTNDLVRSETVGDRRTQWSLDAAGRLAQSATRTKGTDGAWTTGTTITNHYGSTSDSPSWAKSSTGAITRNVPDLMGGLGATTSATGDTVLQLANLHGDIAVRLPLDTSIAPTIQHYDEYGNRLDGTASATYGWLGAHQRAGDTLSDVSLMGVRLYDPATGRFLQTDPVYGGNDNAYEYCRGNPVGCVDLDGAYSYKYTYTVGYFYSSAKQVFSWVRTHFWVFPFTGCGATLSKGERCNLAYGAFPVKVTKLGKTYWQFKSLKGHLEGAGKYIKFSLSKSWGRVKLTVQASGANSKWFQRNMVTRWGNSASAYITWGWFAANIGLFAPLW
ncbi:DNRLRE domain-containing protein [Streptomyces niveus]|uniref:DNRLRE domain-containing protein n=1 Tax=Streptomyces niveus TaxID=193462 RepID=UPI00342B9D4F